MKMITSIYLTGIALILLVPFIFFLPLGFSRAGKITLIALSSLLAIVGIAASSMFSLWQTSAILLILAISFTYLITKRFGAVLFVEQLITKKDHIHYPIVESQSKISFPPIQKLPHNKIEAFEIDHNKQVYVEDDNLEININEIVENRKNNRNVEENKIVMDEVLPLNVKNLEITSDSDRFNKSEAIIIENEDKYEVDDGQLEDFFENRLTFIENLEIDHKGEKNQNNKKNDLSVFEVESTEEKAEEDILSDDDYIIPEINFELRNRK